MFVVDTNILLYGINASSPFHARCRDLLASWQQQSLPWYVTWPILYEFLRVATHPRVFQNPLAPREAWRIVEILLSSPGLSVLSEGNRHPQILAEIIAAVPELRGSIYHDVHTVALMREHGIRMIYTRDTHLFRFPFIEVQDPVR